MAIDLVAELLEHACNRTSCSPANADLAASLGCTVRYVQYALTALEAAGWIAIELSPRHPYGRRIALTWRDQPLERSSDAPHLHASDAQHLHVWDGVGTVAAPAPPATPKKLIEHDTHVTPPATPKKLMEHEMEFTPHEMEFTPHEMEFTSPLCKDRARR